MNTIKFEHTNEAVVEHFPPLPAKKMIPDWYKKLRDDDAQDIPDFMNKKIITIKNCMPAMDMITAGYILRCPEEIQLLAQRIDSKDVESFGYTSNREEAVSNHPHPQCPVRIQGQRKDYFKIMTDWRITTPPGYSCLIVHPQYNFENRFEFLSGIIDTDTFDGKFNMIGYLKTTEKVELKPGDPLVQIIPFKREEWKSEIKYVTKHKDSIFDLYLSINALSRVYKNIMHSKKKFN